MSGTLSMPDVPKGWQRRIRASVIHPDELEMRHFAAKFAADVRQLFENGREQCIQIEGPIKLESKSPDWKSEADALKRLQEVLNSKPLQVQSMPLWSEAGSMKFEYVGASLGKATIESEWHLVCVKDRDGAPWYFRTVAVDGWQK